jgi:hypothetical protein
MVEDRGGIQARLQEQGERELGTKVKKEATSPITTTAPRPSVAAPG